MSDPWRPWQSMWRHLLGRRPWPPPLDPSWSPPLAPTWPSRAAPVAALDERSAVERDAWPDPHVCVDGALRAVEHLGDVDRARLARLLPAGTRIDNGYSLYTITFWSGDDETRATVALPYRADPPRGGWHLVANNHGTTGLGRGAAVVGTDVGAGLAGAFGARGLIGIAPEYHGLTTGRLQPYLVADSESRAAFDALRAARALARWKGWPLSGRCAMVGLSQGGHATLSAAARHRAWAPDLDVRAFAVAGPASGWEEHWRAGALREGSHLVCHAMLFYAWAHHYRFDGPPLWAPSVARTVDSDMREACAWSPSGHDTLEQRLPRRASQLFSRPFVDAYRSGRWGDFGAFRRWFGENRVRGYAQTAPLRVYQGAADRDVPELATRQLVMALRAGGVAAEYQLVARGGHRDTAFGSLGAPDLVTLEAIRWLRSRLDA